LGFSRNHGWTFSNASSDAQRVGERRAAMILNNAAALATHPFDLELDRLPCRPVAYFMKDGSLSRESVTGCPLG